MRAFVVALAAALGTAAGSARADDFVMDMRAPMRAGFAYTGLTRGPALSLSLGLDVDVLPITRRLAFTLVGDVEANSRLDLPEDDPRSAFGGFGAGAGFFYVTDEHVAFGLESVAWATFDNQNVVGGGFSTRAYLIPFYVSIERAANATGDRFGAWVRSALSVWVMGRADWTSDGNAGTLAFGASFDLARILFLPYFFALRKVMR